ncbi:hypothetical protein GCM10011396_23250 [Undibacterium terreum]|uniref:Uncharacterized protein n=2 Tax=Undibacterium terreum TaxID=1224302 RepID=A0A916ULF6_9BURK|nr:hypothetical protein GCM10011396_23250 [Undibacterium terreum]
MVAGILSAMAQSRLNIASARQLTKLVTYQQTIKQVHMNWKNFWPDKKAFANRFGVDFNAPKLKCIRDIECSTPGVTARVVEFDRNFQSVPYVESRSTKAIRAYESFVGAEAILMVNLIIRR